MGVVHHTLADLLKVLVINELFELAETGVLITVVIACVFITVATHTTCHLLHLLSSDLRELLRWNHTNFESDVRITSC